MVSPIGRAKKSIPPRRINYRSPTVFTWLALHVSPTLRRTHFFFVPSIYIAIYLIGFIYFSTLLLQMDATTYMCRFTWSCSAKFVSFRFVFFFVRSTRYLHTVHVYVKLISTWSFFCPDVLCLNKPTAQHCDCVNEK